MLAASYLELKQPDKAIAAYKKALAIRPYRPTTHRGLAEAYRLLGDQSRALEHEEKARWLLQNNQD